ncbi:MAG: hypothetical protein AAGD01_17660 [Acidobacteriota bacterium]
MSDPLESILSTAATPKAVYLVHGDLVLAEPAAQRIAQAVAEAAGVEVETRRRPAYLLPLLNDLDTYSLFGGAKVLLVIDSAVLANKDGAAALVDEAASALPVAAPTADEPGALSDRQRRAASRLLQVLRFFELAPDAGSPSAILDQVPDWVFQGGGNRRKRTKKQREQLRQDLAVLLEVARRNELEGYAEGDLERLAAAVSRGLPQGHCLVLAERAVDAAHPVVRQLQERDAALELQTVRSDNKGRWLGLEALARQLRQETGVGIEKAALEGLAQRTLRSAGRRGDAALNDSTARLAGEYRKLANLAGGGNIDLALVERTVLDRGQEDVFKILDAVGEGRGSEAATRLRRYLSGADDPIAARLSFFSLFAGYCRNLLAVRGMMRLHGLRGGRVSYGQFGKSLEAQLKAKLPTGESNPLSKVKTYPLYRAYLAAQRLSDRQANLLPMQILETELQLKGQSDDADGALARLLSQLATSSPSRRLG